MKLSSEPKPSTGVILNIAPMRRDACPHTDQVKLSAKAKAGDRPEFERSASPVRRHRMIFQRKAYAERGAEGAARFRIEEHPFRDADHARIVLVEEREECGRRKRNASEGENGLDGDGVTYLIAFILIETVGEFHRLISDGSGSVHAGAYFVRSIRFIGGIESERLRAHFAEGEVKPVCPRRRNRPCLRKRSRLCNPLLVRGTRFLVVYGVYVRALVAVVVELTGCIDKIAEAELEIGGRLHRRHDAVIDEARPAVFRGEPCAGTVPPWNLRCRSLRTTNGNAVVQLSRSR